MKPFIKIEKNLQTSPEFGIKHRFIIWGKGADGYKEIYDIIECSSRFDYWRKVMRNRVRQFMDENPEVAFTLMEEFYDAVDADYEHHVRRAMLKEC